MSAIVTLGSLWLNDYVSPGDSISFPYMTAWKPTTSMNGSVRTYAKGRRRAISTMGTSVAYSATLHACTRAQVAWIDNHIGRVLCIRDDRGRRAWGICWTSPVDEHRYNVEAEIDLALESLTISEAV